MSRESKKFPFRIPQRLRRIAGKALLLLAGIALTCAALETYLRLKWPFLNGEYLSHFHPKAGNIRQPNAQMRWTNPHSEFFVVEKINSLGFLDREPLNPEQRETGCHIAFIGDSFVEAKEVAIADKFHVQLERLAAKELPDLNITTSAFGRSGTGQINQLPYYDEFARHLKPCVLVLVFVVNDFVNNYPVLQALKSYPVLRAVESRGPHPDHVPFVTVERNQDGTFRLRPPNRDFRKHIFPRLPMSWIQRARIYSSQRSYLAKWLHSKLLLLESKFLDGSDTEIINMRVKILSRDPRYDSPVKEWTSLTDKEGHEHSHSLYSVFGKKDLPPIFEEALEFTAFGLDQFKKRADQDGVSLVILSTITMGTQGDLIFDRMNDLAKERGIPVIDQADYICRQGKDIEDARWAHDSHWNLAGHQWAAEALLEYLKKNPHICCSQSNRVE